MSAELLGSGAKRVTGIKQTIKAIEKGTAQIIFIAADADEFVIKPLLRAAENVGIRVETVGTMHELGKLCGIHVGAAAAALLKS